MRTGAVFAWVAGFGFGVPAVYGLWYFVDRGRVATFAGFPANGEGPFEDVGIDTTTALLAGFGLVCAAELVTGWQLWRGRRSGVVLSVALLPVELVYWIGFALPFGPVLGAGRVIAVAVNRSRAEPVARSETGAEADRSR